MVLAGDCVINPEESTGNPSLNRALQLLITGLKLYVAWKQQGGTKVYTYYTPTSAMLIHRVYVSQLIIQHRRHTETIAASFTEHLAVSLYIDLPTCGAERASVYWKLNATLLNDEQVKATFRVEWEN
jgi:hypothetical protein